MNDVLLKKFVTSVLNEAGSSHEHFSMSSYATPAKGDFTRTFVEPFIDVFDTAATVVGSAANANISLVKRIISVVLYDILPDIVAKKIIPRVDAIVHSEQEYANKIRQKYGDVFKRNSDALFSGDAALFAFFAEPASFLAGAALIKAPAAVSSVLQTAAHGNALQDPSVRGPIKTMLAHLKELQNARVTREGMLNERELTADDHIVAIRKILQQPNVVHALRSQYAGPNNEATAGLRAMQKAILDDIESIVDDNADEIAKILSAQIAAKITSPNDTAAQEDVKQEETNASVPQDTLISAASMGLRAAYVDVLRAQAVNTKSPHHKRIFDTLLKKIGGS